MTLYASDLTSSAAGGSRVSEQHWLSHRYVNSTTDTLTCLKAQAEVTLRFNCSVCRLNHLRRMINLPTNCILVGRDSLVNGADEVGYAISCFPSLHRTKSGSNLSRCIVRVRPPECCLWLIQRLDLQHDRPARTLAIKQPRGTQRIPTSTCGSWR